jgi:citrate synthase
MSQTDELGSAQQRRVDTAVPTDLRRKGLDWAVLVVLFALGCTLGWISLLLWGALRAFQIALL